jgi:hypothetical protein
MRTEADKRPKLRSYIEQNNVAYPMALLGGEGVAGGFEVVMDKAALAECKGDAKAFVKALQSKGLVSEGAASA